MAQEAPGSSVEPQLFDCAKSCVPVVTPMPFTVAGLLPSLVMVTVLVAAVVPTLVASKATWDGLTDSVVVGTTAVPLTAKLAVVPVPATVRVELKEPA